MEFMLLPSRFLFLFLASFFWVILDKAMAEGVTTVTVHSPAPPPPPPLGVATKSATATAHWYPGAAPDEVRALNRVFQQWNLTAPPNEWNISGEPCSGAALSETRIHDMGDWPSIKCDCSYDSGSTCRITELRIYRLNVVGPIPEELWSLSYLKYLYDSHFA